MQTNQYQAHFVLTLISLLFFQNINAQSSCITHTIYDYEPTSGPVNSAPSTTTTASDIQIDHKFVNLSIAQLNYLGLNNVPQTEINEALWKGVSYNAKGNKLRENQLIVKFKNAAKESDKAAIRDAHHAIIIETFYCDLSGIELELWFCNFDSLVGINLEDKTATLSSSIDIESHDFNYIVDSNPTTKTVSKNILSPYTIPVNKPVKVAVIDNGIDEFHNDIAGHVNLEKGYDFVNHDTIPHDTSAYHGTHIASTILNFSNYKSEIINLKTFEKGSDKNTLFYVTVATYHAICKGANIINMSWGWMGEPAQCLKEAIHFAHTTGDALVVCSAGNDSLNLNGLKQLHYPSGYAMDHIIEVTALDSAGVGPAPYANRGSEIDLATIGHWNGALPNAGFGSMEGTSVSAAVISGVTANLVFQNPSSSACEVKRHYVATNSSLSGCNQPNQCLKRLYDIKSINELVNIPVPADVKGLICGLKHQETQQTPPDSKRLNTSSAQLESTIFNNQDRVQINLNLDTESLVQIQIVDITGRIIQSTSKNRGSGAHQLQFDMNNQPTGMYLVSLMINGNQTVKKIIR